MKRLMKWMPLVVWCLIIFFLSHRPVPQAMNEDNTFVGIDWLYHGMIYAIGGYLFFRLKNSLLGVVIFCFLYGLSDEIHQSFLSFHSFEWGDLIIDTLGGFCGGLLNKYKSIIWS